MPITFLDENIADRILRGGKPEATAIIQGSGITTYASLADKTHRMGCALLECSEKGDRIGLLAENGLFWIAAYLGTMRAGRVTVPLPGDISDSALSFIAQNTGMRSIYVSKRCQRKYRAVLDGLGIRIIGEDEVFPEVPGARMTQI